MITKFALDKKQHLVKTTQEADLCLWIDLDKPSQAEYAEIENALGIELPEHHEVHQLEYSNRFYQEGEATFLSLNVVTTAWPFPENHIVTFVLTKKQMITLRFSDPNPIYAFIKNQGYHGEVIKDNSDLLMLLLHAFVGRAADVFEIVSEKADDLSKSLSKTVSPQKKISKSEVLDHALKTINNLDDLISKGMQSLESLELLVAFIQRISQIARKVDPDQLHILSEDIRVLLEHGNFLTQKINFQLNSTLGLINIEQTKIIKIFTVMAMIFMPPTLIASIYGMNFKHMPEIQYWWGYPIAVVVMIFASYLPFRYFKKKRWI